MSDPNTIPKWELDAAIAWRENAVVRWKRLRLAWLCLAPIYAAMIYDVGRSTLQLVISAGFIVCGCGLFVAQRWYLRLSDQLARLKHGENIWNDECFR